MFTIYSYHNVSSLAGLLNAIAAISGADDYRSALAAVVAIGFMVAVGAYALAPQKLQGWYWLASVTLVLSVLFVPKTTVQVEDVSNGEPPKVIANVPYGLAFMAGFSGAIGHTLTVLFETTMQTIPDPAAVLPAELSYQNNGMVFGARLVSSVQKTTFGDATFRTDLVNFISNCVEPDINSGYLPVGDVIRSKDLWTTFNNTNPGRMTTVTRPAGIDIVTCGMAYDNLDTRMPDQVAQATMLLATAMHPGPGNTADKIGRTSAELARAMEVQQLVDAGTSTSDFIRHVALIGAVGEAGNLSAQRAGDAASVMMSLSRTQALVQTNTSFVNNAKIAEQALPVVRNVIEALTFALFPLAVLLMLLSGGKETLMALKNYASVLIWIQLWPPLYAVLNYMSMIYTNYDMQAAAELGNGMHGLTLGTSGAINGAALSNQAVVGYLIWSVPVIAWGALKRMENFGTTVAGALTQLGQSASSSTASAMNGNAGLGSMSYNQVNASPSQTSPFVRSRQDGATGSTFTTNGEGTTWRSDILNRGAVQDTMKLQYGLAMGRATKLQRVQSENQAVSAMNSLGAVVGDALKFGSSIANSDVASKGRTDATTHAAAQQFAKSEAEIKQFMMDHGITDSRDARAAILGSITTLLGPGGAAVAGGLGLGVNLGGTHTDGKKLTWGEVKSAVENGTFTETQSALRSISNTLDERANNTVGDLKGRDISSSLNKTTQATSTALASLSTARSVEASNNTSAALSRERTIDITGRDPVEFARLNPEHMNLPELQRYLAGDFTGSMAKYQEQQFEFAKSQTTLHAPRLEFEGETVSSDTLRDAYAAAKDQVQDKVAPLTPGQQSMVRGAKSAGDQVVGIAESQYNDKNPAGTFRANARPVNLQQAGDDNPTVPPSASIEAQGAATRVINDHTKGVVKGEQDSAAKREALGGSNAAREASEKTAQVAAPITELGSYAWRTTAYAVDYAATSIFKPGKVKDLDGRPGVVRFDGRPNNVGSSIIDTLNSVTGGPVSGLSPAVIQQGDGPWTPTYSWDKKITANDVRHLGNSVWNSVTFSSPEPAKVEVKQAKGN